MHCVLCHQPLDLFDTETVLGEPAHGACARTAREAEEAATAMVMAEPDPRLHRRHLRPVAAA